jgi:hypothetical protein
MKITAEPRSDQWNADDFVGGPRTFTIAGVKVGTAEQKYDIELVEGEGRSWRPPLTMLRLLISGWGDEAATWTGRRVTLYRDETVKFGSDAVGGIRVSHMSHLPNGKPMTVKLTSTRGRRASHTVEPLPDTPPPTTKAPSANAIIDAFKALGVSLDQLETRVGSPQDAWTAEDVAALSAVGKSIKSGATTLEAEFPDPDTEDAGQLGLSDGES